MDAQHIALGLITYVVMLFSLSVHESAHAWMALRLGDDTAYRQGRVSLNPIVHIDPVGTFLLPMLQIFGPQGIPLLGWAKPTPYDPANFGRAWTVRQGHILVAAAGPVSNFLLAITFTAALWVTVRAGLVNDLVMFVLVRAVGMNVLLGVFNLIPIPPLDGSKVASFGLPQPAGDAYDRIMEPYGFMILLVLVGTRVIGYVTDPVVRFVQRLLFALVT